MRNDATWRLELYATSNQGEYPNTPDYTKDTDTATLPCGQQRTLRLSYDWQSHSHRFWWARLFRNGVAVSTTAVVVK